MDGSRDCADGNNNDLVTCRRNSLSARRHDPAGALTQDPSVIDDNFEWPDNFQFDFLCLVCGRGVLRNASRPTAMHDSSSN